MDMLGGNIRRLRKARGMSQWALAYEIDAAQETIHRIEVGRAKLVKPGHLRLLSDLFGVSIDELVYQMEM